MREDTRKFLEILDKQNRSIAAQNEAEQAARDKIESDHIRLQREEERREKYGQLRAREKPGHRQRRVRSLFGIPDLSTND